MLINKFAVISAYKNGSTYNQSRHYLMRSALNTLDIKYIESEGVFEGQYELSYLIPNPDLSKMEALRVLFEQDCFLYVEDGKGYLSKNGNERLIGKLNIDNTLKNYDRTKVPSLGITFNFVEE